MSEKKEKTRKTGKKKKVPKKPVEQPKKPTLKEKIDRTVEDYIEDKEELKKQVFGLVQRVLYPDQFCPECNDRLFFGPTGWSCPNCGFKRQPTQAVSQPVARPSETNKVPPQVEKMIQNTKEPRRVMAPTKKGKTIRQLVDQMDSGGASGPSPQDEAKVRGDRNVSSKINWV